MVLRGTTWYYEVLRKTIFREASAYKNHSTGFFISSSDLGLVPWVLTSMAPDPVNSWCFDGCLFHRCRSYAPGAKHKSRVRGSMYSMDGEESAGICDGSSSCSKGRISHFVSLLLFLTSTLISFVWGSRRPRRGKLIFKPVRCEALHQLEGTAKII